MKRVKLTPVLRLCDPRDQVRLSRNCQFLRSTKVGLCVSGPSDVRPVTLIVPSRVLGMKNSFGSNVSFSIDRLCSNAWFHATLTSLSSRPDRIHLCSATTDCDLVRTPAVHIGM